MTPAGGLPVLLWALGALGMLWADVSWSDRIDGLGAFHKLLVIPLLLAQFRRSERARWVVIGFLGSALVLLVVSWWLALIPGLTWRGNSPTGVPVKDYILQSGIFALCALRAARAGGRAVARATAGGWRWFWLSLAALFIANIVYVVTGRTTIVVMVVLLLMFGCRLFGWKGVLAAGAHRRRARGPQCGCPRPICASASTASPRTSRTIAANVNTPVGLRLEFWRKSIDFVAEAPLIGHGTGTIQRLFRARATAETLPQAITTNPHNQMFAVAHSARPGRRPSC